MTKYRAKRVVIDDIPFASKMEGRRYEELKALRDGGVISELVLQPRFPVIINGRKVFEYRADFSYWDEEQERARVEDVKGFKTQVYRIKKACVEAQYGIEIEEVQA